MGIKELSLELAAVSLIADEAKKAKDRLIDLKSYLTTLLYL